MKPNDIVFKPFAGRYKLDQTNQVEKK